MAKNISLLGADYPDVPAVTLPQTGGGTATFYDVEVTDGDPTLEWGTRSKVGTVQGTDLHVTMPANPAHNIEEKSFTQTTDANGGFVYGGLYPFQIPVMAKPTTDYYGCIIGSKGVDWYIRVVDLRTMTPVANTSVSGKIWYFDNR